MAEENISRECKLENINETRNYLIEEINRNEFMSKKHKKVCATLNYIEHFLILGSTITQCVFISAFSSWLGIPYRNYEFWNWIKNLCNNCSN